MTKLEQKQQEYINLLRNQVIDLSMMSKIELGDDVIIEALKLQSEIEELKDIDYLKTNLKKGLVPLVPFVDEVEEFNAVMGKPNNYEPTIPERKEWEFVYNFILEELEEYREACEAGNIIEVLDALCDITYVSLGNGAMLHGLKDKIWPAYQEVQASNMSKACQTEEDAKTTVIQRSSEQGEECHYEKVGDYFIVYRSRDRKVMKNIKYFRPNLKQFFTDKEIQKSYLKQITGN
jgi:predicted HAD superfamily Cof-like phosphohydrolase